uniref:Uncharacterized protein n=1 Tax=Anopheles farauti TaxID=69004 RepID=A0A182QTE9_9DIPT
MVPPGANVEPDGESICSEKLLGTAAFYRSLNRLLPLVVVLFTTGEVGLVRLPSTPPPSGEPTRPVTAGIVGMVGERLEFSRLSSPPKEEEFASSPPPVPFLMLLSLRLFRSSPIPPSIAGVPPPVDESDELTAAGGVLAGISRLPSRSSRS